MHCLPLRLHRRVVRLRDLPLLASLFLHFIFSSLDVAGADVPPPGRGATGAIAGRVEHAATGQSLHNARVAVAGSDLLVFTDESGAYRLAGVPAGPVVLRIFFTGLAPAEVTVTVPAGGQVRRDAALERMAGESGPGVVKLGAFVVADSREMDPETIAINEQRFSPNIKNVVAAGAFGDIAEGNVGEFMKYLPSVTADFADPTILSISVRGLNSYLTTVTSDGAQMSNAHYGGSTRVFQFEQVSINNIARVELTKIPAPSQPADTLGGTVNMVSKSAFERRKAQLSYRLYLSANQGDLTTARVPHSFEERHRRVLPNADFNYTLPVNDRFGIVVSGLTSNQFNDLFVSANVFNATAVGTGATFARPYFQQHILQDAPRFTYRNSLSLKADWRVTPNAVLSASVQANKFWNFNGMHQMTSNAGTVATSTVAGGVPLQFGPDRTVGATGRGGVTLDGQFFNIRGATKAGNVRYRFDNGGWRVESTVSASGSRTYFRDTDAGHFFSTTSTLTGPLRVTYSAITPDGPGAMETFNNAGQVIDYHNIANYRLTTATSSLRDIKDDVRTVDLSARRQLTLFAIPAAFQIGGAQRFQKRDTRRADSSWTYNGPDGNPNTADTPAPYAAQVYRNREANFGFVDIPWVSPHRAWQAFQQTPSLFSKTAAQVVTAETFRITNSEVFEETVNAAFVQGEFRLFRNRLNVVTGVRYEETTGKGRGALVEPTAVFLRNADGSFAHNAAGARIRRPEAGAVGSIEELRLVRTERGARAERSYDGFYPSVHLTANATENVLVRAAYAKTYGRPNFNQIIANATVNEFDAEDGELGGTISLRNPGLRPWSADNFELSLEYYTRLGGMASVGVFRKDVKNFFASGVRIATAKDLAELDLDPRYLGWQLTTQYNAGSARMSGIEVNLKHTLSPLGRWARGLEVFANGTKLDLDAGDQAGFANVISGSANWGFTFTRNPMTLMAKWNYRGLTRGTRIPGVGVADGYQWDQARTTLDLNLDYRLSARIGLFANARNALGENPVALRYGGETPAYARQFRVQQHGGQYALGLKGTF
ncbi:TonB-dependent receptor [Horticoccus sp. 23ND18S-11]|uniref:TonB-dependent receptor n=1 Tax=Horticoccus sp. 23ND18S-11 TaxID=3391832 RepID=UPI0039C9964F